MVVFTVRVNGSAASSHTQTLPDQQESSGLPAATTYLYWTNSNNGSVGRAINNGSGMNEKFIPAGPQGGAGITVSGKYIYWTTANGGSATNIARANLNGTGVNR